MEVKLYHFLLPVHNCLRNACYAGLKRSAGVLYCLMLGLLCFSESVKGQSEGFPISVTPCPTVGTGYNTFLYLGTGAGESGYDYHWYKGTDYTGTYLGTTNVSIGGIGADIEISGFGAGDYVCYVTAEGYYPDPVNFFYGSAVITIGEYNLSAPVISSSTSKVCFGLPVTLYSNIPDVVWYLNKTGSPVGTGSYINVSDAGVYNAVTQICTGEVSAWSNDIEISVPSIPPAPSITADALSFCNGGNTTLHATGSNIYWYRNGELFNYGNDIVVTQAGSYYARSSNGCDQQQSYNNGKSENQVYYADNSNEKYTWIASIQQTDGALSDPSNTIIITITDPPGAPTITPDSSTLLCNGASVTLTSTGSGIVWSTGQTGNSIIVSAAGSYTATASNSCGTSGASNTIEVTTGSTPSAPSISPGSSTLLCNGATVTLTSTGSGVVWSTGQTGNSITVSSAGNYTATASNSCGTSYPSNTITVTTGVTPAAPSITPNGSTFLCDGATITLTSTGSGVVWSTGQAANSITVSSAGNYTATASNSCGTSYPSNTISVTTGATPGAPTISAGGSTLLCNGATVTLTSTGSGVVWSTGQTGNSITVSSAGNYTATASNSCGTSYPSNTITVTTGSMPGAPTITPGSSTLLCNGATVTLTSTGSGVVWSTGETGNSITVSAAGSYTATASNSCGTSGVSNTISVITSTTPGAPTISAGGSTLLCNGASVTLTSTGSGVVWSTGQAGNSITVSSAGNYTATASNSCGTSYPSNTISVTTGATPGAPTITAGGSTLLCNGASVTLTSTGSGVVWSTGQTGNSITVSAAGNYTATASNSCGTSYPSNGITVATGGTPGVPTITPGSSTLLCNGSTVTLTSTGSGIVWSTGETGNSITVSAAGSYTATASNSCGISGVSNTIVVTTSATPSAPTITAGSSTFLCNGASVTLTSTGSGVVWSTGQTGNSITVTAAGSYTATASNSCGTSGISNTIAITTSDTPSPPIITAGSSTLLCNGATVTLTATGSGVVWSTGHTGNSITISAAGNYTATASNSCGTSGASNTIAVTTGSTPAAPTISAGGSTLLCNGAEVLLSATGSGIQWYRDGNILSGATGSYYTASVAGNYTVMSTNSCGTSVVSNVIEISTGITPSAPSVTAGGSTLLCNGANVILNSTGSNIQWYKDGNAISGATGSSYTANIAGSYTTISSGSCGSSAASNIINVSTGTTPAAPVITASGTTSLCNGVTVTLTSTGSGVVWSTGQSGNSITVSAAGNYTATASNNCGTSAESNIIVVTTGITPAAPVITAGSSTFLCNGATVTLTSTGSGVVWSTGQTGNSITVNAAGNYTATTSNECGMSGASNVIIVSTSVTPNPPSITSNHINPVCNGAIVLLNTSGSGIQWYRDGTAISAATGLSYSTSIAGNYTATVSNDCGISSFSNAIQINTGSSPATPSISASGPVTFCDGGAVTLSAPEGYTYLWSNGQTTRDIVVTTAGNYRVTIYNETGCSSMSSYTAVTILPVPAKPVVTASGPTVFCEGGSVTLSAPLAYGYLWSNGAVTNSITVSASGTYTVTVDNGSGCYSTSDSVQVSKMLIAVNGQRSVCQNETVTLYASPGFTSYQWYKSGNAITSPVGTMMSLITSEAGVYTVQGSVAGGSCTSLPFQLSKFSSPLVNITTTAVAIDSASYEKCGPARFNINVTDPDSLGQPVTTFLEVEYDDGSTAEIEGATVTLSKSAQIEVRAVSAAGCSVTRTFSFLMNDNIPLPAVIASGPTSFCQGESVTLTAPDGYTYLWSNGATGQSITISTAGEYKVKVTNTDGCFSFSNPVSVMVNPLNSSN